MRAIFFIFFVTVALSAHAEIYKCVKNGKTTYSEDRCDGSVKTFQPAGSAAGLKEGLAAFDSGNYELAFSLLNPLGESGVPAAQNALGRMYLQGQGVAANPEKALALFRRAAGQGLPGAKNNLGVIYAAGNVVPRDYPQAMVWFKQAAEQGFGPAMDNLADMYENGLGVKRDQDEATKWRQKSREAAPAAGSSQAGRDRATLMDGLPKITVPPPPPVVVPRGSGIRGDGTFITN